MNNTILENIEDLIEESKKKGRGLTRKTVDGTLRQWGRLVSTNIRDKQLGGEDSRNRRRKFKRTPDTRPDEAL
jgi:hypothetical protein